MLGFVCSLEILTGFCKVSLGADLEVTADFFSLQDCMWIFRKSLTAGECQSVRVWIFLGIEQAMHCYSLLFII